jgi:hypothetical protein
VQRMQYLTSEYGKTMPWKSISQSRWGHSKSGLKALGGKSKVAEWDAATPKGSLSKKGKWSSAAKQKARKG